jgi:hypothetical protein
MGANGSRRRQTYKSPKYEYAASRRRWEHQRSISNSETLNRDNRFENMDTDKMDEGLDDSTTTLQTGRYNYVFAHTKNVKYLRIVALFRALI